MRPCLAICVGLVVGAGITFIHQSGGATPDNDPPNQKKPLTNSIGMKLVLIPAGKFLMGSPETEKPREREEEQHEVEITRPFYMGIYEVTQDEFTGIMKSNPSHYGPKGEGTRLHKDLKREDLKRHPVENVTWDEAASFCRKLSELPDEKKAGRVYRLPTEAEWEYACRAGTTTPFHYGQTISASEANYDDTAKAPFGPAKESGRYLSRTMPVGSFKPNAFGLYDMHGNVCEWCQDAYDAKYYLRSPKKDPVNDPEKPVYQRVNRGGSWWIDRAEVCKSAHRGKFVQAETRYFEYGFRVVMTETKP